MELCHYTPTLLDILQPKRFESNAKRDEVTRTVVQPQIDRFELEVEIGDDAAAHAWMQRTLAGL